MRMSNNTYDVLKKIALYGLPALATLYGALSKIWGLPYGSEITLTITALDTFLATILGISTHNYNKFEEFKEDREPGIAEEIMEEEIGNE